MRKQTRFQERVHGKRTVDEKVQRLRFHFAMKHATDANARHGAPIAKRFHAKFRKDGVYSVTAPARGVNVSMLLVVRAGAVLGTKLVPIDDTFGLARVLRLPGVLVKFLDPDL